MTIGEEIRFRRTALNLTQLRLARMVGVSKQHIGNAEGDRPGVDIFTRRKIQQALSAAEKEALHLAAAVMNTREQCK